MSQTTIKGQAELAMPILEVLSNSNFKITDTATAGECEFSVRNYNEEGKTTETNLQYVITIKDTIDPKLKDTITYELYKNGNKVELNNQSTQNMKLTNKKQQEDKYVLKVQYDKNKSAEMGNILDKVQIQVHSEQERSK